MLWTFHKNHRSFDPLPKDVEYLVDWYKIDEADRFLNLSEPEMIRFVEDIKEKENTIKIFEIKPPCGRRSTDKWVTLDFPNQPSGFYSTALKSTTHWG